VIVRWLAATVGLCAVADRFEVELTFSGSARFLRDNVISVDLSGELRGLAVVKLQTMIFESIVAGLPDELVVDLEEVSFLGCDGHWALVSGYVVAVEYGTSYRVVNARGQVRSTLQANQTLDMLADSRDIGALLQALLRRPAPRTHLDR